MTTLQRMQVDTHWAYNRKVRKLQRLYPADWPHYWACYMALLGEAWHRGREGRRLTVEDAWVPAMPCSVGQAMAALVAAGIVDRAGRIPVASWREYVEPVLEQLEAKRAGGVKGAQNRWGKGSGNSSPNGSPNAIGRKGRNRGNENGRASARVDGDPKSLGELLGDLPWRPQGQAEEPTQ